MVLLFLFVIVPVALSFLITNSRFRPPERGPTDPESLQLKVEHVEFRTEDEIVLRGWWSPGETDSPVIVFLHGLNRSRLEHLERAAEANKRGYGVLLFDLRNHGQSGRAYTTLGVTEARDVCAARTFLKKKCTGSTAGFVGCVAGRVHGTTRRTSMSRLRGDYFRQFLSVIF